MHLDYFEMPDYSTADSAFELPRLHTSMVSEKPL
jgi:hypothetical protein